MIFPKHLQTTLSESDVKTIIAALQQDPRPHYHNDETRIYGMPYEKKDIRFRVEGNTAEVVEVKE